MMFLTKPKARRERRGLIPSFRAATREGLHPSRGPCPGDYYDEGTRWSEVPPDQNYALFAGLLSNGERQLPSYVMATDAFGLGVFAAIGAVSAGAYGAGFVTIMIMAVLTACGLGVVRDMLVREIPAILKSDFYATATLIGGACYAALNVAGLSVETRLACTIAITWLIRVIAMRYRHALPRVKSLPASPSRLTQLRKSSSREKQKEESPKKSAGGNA